ncbi:MAG TPA: nucleoside triphosphate pyrophosphohydrolase [Myxococcota bacterium]|nr:nucleoside triphosphate pyrophosphohydrolase [Myxococcota bacterium]
MSDVGRLLEIMARLRSPQGGCPWDLEQDFASIAPYTIEEAYEVEDAIRRGDLAALRDELGDLLLQVVFHAQMARESGHFDFGDVVESICDKLVRRHPHVFGDAQVETAQAQTDAWERQKAAERAAKGERSAMDGVPLALPALLRARKLVARAARAGLATDAAPGEGAPTPQQIGEMLFAAAELAERSGVDPEQALRDANAAYEARMRAREARRS